MYVAFMILFVLAVVGIVIWIFSNSEPQPPDYGDYRGDPTIEHDRGVDIDLNSEWP